MCPQAEAKHNPSPQPFHRFLIACAGSAIKSILGSEHRTYHSEQILLLALEQGLGLGGTYGRDDGGHLGN